MANEKVLTEENAKKYFESCGNECPFCGSTDISVGSTVSHDEDYAWGKTSCDTCHEEWTDEYRLMAIIHTDSNTEFDNDNLIKELAKPKQPDYYSMAYVYANKSGLELVQVISCYAICKRGESEWCVYKVSDDEVKEERNGIDTKEGAIQEAMICVFMDDLRNTDMVKIDNTLVLFGSSNDSFYGEWDEDGETYTVDIPFDDITSIKNSGVGQWKIKWSSSFKKDGECDIAFFKLTPNGAEINA